MNTDRRQIRRNQLIGAIAGTLGGAMMAATWPVIPTSITWGGALLWGAVIGIALGSLPQIEKIGYIITRSDNRIFNFLVGICTPLLAIGLVSILMRWASG